VGIRHFITTSDGDHVENLVLTDREVRKRRRLMRNIDRKKRGGRNRERARLEYSKFAEWESNRRQDLLHKTTRELVESYSTIALESLDVKGMIMESPCPDDINNAAWGSLKRMLVYKAESAGTQILFVDRYDPTSQLCSCCHKRGSVGKRQTIYRCEHCGFSIDRDVNAARNFLVIGKARAGPEVTPGERGLHISHR
jgi:putative transposase